MNTKSGISMVMVVIMVVVLVIISSTVVVTGSGIVAKTKLKKFGTEMLQVKEATNQYVKRKSGNIDWNIKKVSINSMTTEEIEQYSKENLTKDLNLYVVDLKDIGAETATYGLDSTVISEDVYLYSIETGNIYYDKGYQYEDKVYYTLTDELMDIIK